MYVELDEISKYLNTYITSDGNGFRRAARSLQSLWRIKNNLPIGDHNGIPLGSRLPVELAEKELCNYLSPGIKSVLSDTLAKASEHQLFSKPRIFNDLLSSQPLCFNLFGELKLDLNLTTAVFQNLYPDKIKSITSIKFEYSPERSSSRFTNDRSAFDVFIEYKNKKAEISFIGIEVKYHENLKDKPAPHRNKYDEVASAMGCFNPVSLQRLREAPLQQFWRDHLLAGSMINDKELGYSDGQFLVVSPAGNTDCRLAVQNYRKCLTECSSFDAITLEEIISNIKLFSSNEWVHEFEKRYLDFSQLFSYFSNRG